MDRANSNSAKSARVLAARTAIVKELNDAGWRPTLLSGYSNRVPGYDAEWAVGMRGAKGPD